MFEEKESFWKKKGFYACACVLLVGIMAVGAIASRKFTVGGGNENKMMANIATEVPGQAPKSTEDAPVPKNKNEDAAQANAPVSKDTSSKEGIQGKKQASTKQAATKKETDNKKNADTGKGTDVVKKAENSTKEDTTPQQKPETNSQAASATSDNIKHSFNEESGLLWPVKGDIILKYSMNNTIYFKTLAQYKCNPAIMISAKKGAKVKAAADCQVTKIEKDDELGTVITTDIGDNYTLRYGQMDNISVNKGDEIKEGDIIGTVAEPTKYFSEEGSNLYFQVKEGSNTVDPLLLLR